MYISFFFSLAFRLPHSCWNQFVCETSSVTLGAVLDEELPLYVRESVGKPECLCGCALGPPFFGLCECVDAVFEGVVHICA